MQNWVWGEECIMGDSKKVNIVERATVNPVVTESLVTFLTRGHLQYHDIPGKGH